VLVTKELVGFRVRAISPLFFKTLTEAYQESLHIKFSDQKYTLKTSILDGLN
jgi:hypothetical protein